MMGPETMLLRQVHPGFVQEGRVSSQAFLPTKKDEGLLSTYDGDLILAEASWRHFSQVLGQTSAGVLGVKVGECAAIGLAASSDTETFPEHAVLDYSPFGNKEVKRKALLLRDKADARGWLFQPPT